MDVDVTVLVDEGLGNNSYLLDLGDGRALAVDASRDLRSLRTDAAGRGLPVAFAADTHLHADFLSGAVDLAAEGATVLASAAGNRQFAHRGLYDGDEVDLGGLTLRALVTPGHTDEHLALLLSDGSRPVGVFTGGSLLVGAAARTDLLGQDRAEELARAQYASLERLLTLPDDTVVWPTHGAGSFCSAPPGADRTSTIGRERRTNPLLQATDADAFVAALLGSLGSYPAYFARLGELNRRGPARLPAAPALPELSVAEVQHLLERGTDVVDVRPVEAYAAGHLPGSLSIPLREVFVTWLGWLADDSRPLLIVQDAGADPDEVVWQAAKIGMEHLLAGRLAGVEAWARAGHRLVRTGMLAADNLADTASVLDVRQAPEFRAGHVPGAFNLELGRLTDPAAVPPPGPTPTLVMCGHGERASSAASLLERAGHRDVRIVTGGPVDWAATSRRTLLTGP